ncbi:BMN2 family, Pseudo gene [Babesia microti strain RI]|uniref:BMN2 family, Pseudo protein n=1 Tax=Babesia microti (strain RI) TaxID=1133968 RepID=I7IFX6_BABMR|nr:BMN2 family, Pseudo gene [Babesia microti strain RI]CCF73161.1 BMN2 family, Pseudo gene [Babesia microti strain RI]|eukprot:XP_012647770.1 BMN2 family, Pseudo gene [Babesia microti strain RI]
MINIIYIILYTNLFPNRYRLIYQNKIVIIKISNYIIKFDDNAKLPNYNVLYIQIYTCEHNNPLLVYFRVSIG